MRPSALGSRGLQSTRSIATALLPVRNGQACLRITKPRLLNPNWLLASRLSSTEVSCNNSAGAGNVPIQQQQQDGQQEASSSQGTNADLSHQHNMDNSNGQQQQSSTSSATSSPGTSPSDAAQPAAPPKTAAQKAGNFANRVFFGITLGLGGAAMIISGGYAFLALLVFVAYQATQEYYGFITSKGITKGMTPPPPLVSALTTVMCISITLLAFFLQARSGTVLAVAAFLLLVLEVIAIKKPKFSQLASSVFGLFYCGKLAHASHNRWNQACNLQSAYSMHAAILASLICTFCHYQRNSA